MSRAHEVVVTGRGLVSPLADSPEGLYQAFLEGRNGLRPRPDFEAQGLRLGPVGAIDFDPRAYLSEGNLRPIDRTGQLVIVAAGLALADAGLDDQAREGLEVGLALGTQYGSVHTIAAFDQRALEAGPKYVKPFDFANSVINAAAGQTAIWHKLRGVNSTVAGGPVAGVQALAYAADAIRHGRAEVMLAGGGEELCFESAFAYHHAGLLASTNGGDPENPRRQSPGVKNLAPFDRDRTGFVPGEGAALLVLESRAHAEGRGARILGRVHGQGAMLDLSLGSDDEMAGQAVARAIRLALDDSELEPARLSAVSSGASGSVTGDRHEAIGLARALDDGVPITAVKGLLGEAFGASGGFQAVVLLEALARRHLPGIPGLRRRDEQAPAGITAEGHDLKDDGPLFGLLTALGHDGNVSALVLEGADHA